MEPGLTFDFISRVVGLVSIASLFAIKFYIASTAQVPKTIDFRMLETLRIAVLWTSVYVFFLLVLQLLSLFDIGTMTERRIVSNWASLIPLIAIIVHWFLSKKMIDNLEEKQKQQMHDNEQSFQN